MGLFARSLTALHTAVIELADEDFVTPAATEATHNATTYWNVDTESPSGDAAFDALTVRLAAADPPAASLARSRELLQNIAGTAFPMSISDKDALLIATGRRAPSPAEVSALGELASRIPLSVG